MPKLFWKQKVGEVLQLSNASSRFSSGVVEEDESDSTLPVGTNRVKRNVSLPTSNLLGGELPTTRSFDESLSALRLQVDNHSQHSIRQSRKNEVDEKCGNADFHGLQFPEEDKKNGLNRNISVTGISVSGLHPREPSRSLSSPQAENRYHFYDTSEDNLVNGHHETIEDDITKMAAQRDQQRVSTRYIRGMMAPVLGKEEEQRKQGFTQKRTIPNQRSDSRLDIIDGIESAYKNSAVMKPLKLGDRILLQRVGKIQPAEDDIMEQSIRRQSLKDKLLSTDSGQPIGSQSGVSSLRIRSTNDFTVLTPEKSTQSEEAEMEARIYNNSTSREDVQILNLQGYMDSATLGHRMKVDSKRRLPKRANQRKVLDRHADVGRKGSRSTGEKLRKYRGIPSYQNEGTEAVLRDIDDIDEQITRMVISAKRSAVIDAVSRRPITFEEAVQLRHLLTGNPIISLPLEWLNQSFVQNKNKNISYGILQKKGGPCGVLASVQAHIMKNLIFGSKLAPNVSIASPLRPSSREWSWALAISLTDILWRINNRTQRAILALPGSFSHFSDHGVGVYTPDGVTETITLYEFVSESSLYSAIESHLQVFTREATSGCVLLLYSALLTRGLDKVAVDMDAGGGYLINSHGYASQEVVNLLLTGQATTNTFDGDHTFCEDGSRYATNALTGQKLYQSYGREMILQYGKEESKTVLRGIKKRSEIGLLSLFEHYGACKVGSYLKSPFYPVWVVCSESHYTVLFSRDEHIAGEERPFDPFNMYFYDGLAMQEDEIQLTIDTSRAPVEPMGPVPPLELCIRTKWPDSYIAWNGADPIL